VRACIRQSFYLGLGQFPFIQILLQPVFPIDRQYDVEDIHRQRCHGVNFGYAPINAFFNTGVSIKLNILLGRYPSCSNGGFVYRNRQANQAGPSWTLGMKDVSNDQSTEQSLAINHHRLTNLSFFPSALVRLFL
jgi:hypothetical protein